MATSQAILVLDSGPLIAAGKSENVEAIVRRWRSGGARFVIAAASIAESIRGGARDAAANRLIKAVGHVEPSTEHVARIAGALLGKARSDKTVDALVIATAVHCRATDLLTSDRNDMRLFADGSLNVHTF